MSTVNKAVIAVAKVIKRCNVDHPWMELSYLARPLHFLAMRQGEHARSAYPETYAQLEELFGRDAILVAQLDAFVAEDIPRDRRLIIEELYRQVTPILESYMAEAEKEEAPDYVRSLAASLAGLDITSDAILRGAVPDDENHLVLWYAVQKKYFDDPMWLEA
ncbi:hypothetical protein D9M68_20250 [compost metagenome]